MTGFWLDLIKDNELESNWKLFSSEVNHFSYSNSFHLWAKHFYQEKGQFEEFSMRIMKGSELVGFWPLFLVKQEGGDWFGHYGKRIYEPMVFDVFREEIDFAMPQLINHILKRAKENNINKIFIQSGQRFPLLLGDLTQSYTFMPISELTCDLSLSLEEIWSSIRKSYKPLIHRELRNFDVTFENGKNFSSMNEFADLHARAAGRTTRSIEDWEIQGEAIKNDEGVVCYVRNSAGRLIGASFCNIAGEFALYSTGAYDRQVMQTGAALGHLTQWEIIKYLKRETDVTSYILHPGSVNLKVSQKEEQILHFKSGFARKVNIQKVFEIPIS